MRMGSRWKEGIFILYRKKNNYLVLLKKTLTKFMTAILTPRLRVDNCYKIYKYDGFLMSKWDFSSSELYDVKWISPNDKKYPDIPPSPKEE